MDDEAKEIRRVIAELSPEKRALFNATLARNQAARGPTITALKRAPGENRVAASFGQERLFFLNEVDPHATAYLMPIALRLRGKPDPNTLGEAFTALVVRHEALRTGFALNPQHGLQQVIRPTGEVNFDLAVGAVAESAVPARIEELVTTPFDLTAAPLIRAALWHVDGAEPDEWILVICAHHIVMDGWSLGVLVDELGEIYRARLAGRDPKLANLPVQYADYAAWQRERSAEPSATGENGYWSSALADAPILDLPTDHPRPLIQSFEGNAAAVQLSPELAAALTRRAKAERATLFMALLAGLTVVLGRWANQRDMVIGTAVAGRQAPEAERVIGFCVNTLPLRMRCNSDESFAELLHRVRQNCLEAFAHQDTPFEQIVRESAATRHGARNMLLQTLLTLRNVPLDTLDLPGVDVRLLDLPMSWTDLDLSVELAPTDDGGLTGWVVYSTDLFSTSTIERFVESLHSIYAAAARTPDVAVGDLPLTSLRTRSRIVAELSGAGVHADSTALIHEVFAERAQQTPEAIAIVADGADHPGQAELSYGQLDARANRLANWLSERLVTVEDRIGVCVHRSLDLLVALVAVFKIGATYLPLDPDLPVSRLSYIVDDACPRLILSTTDLADRFTEIGESAPVVHLDAASCTIGDASEEPPAVALSPRNAAYLMYTSGSTGTPKGVVVTHEGLTCRLRWMVATLDLRHDDVVLHRTTVSADPSLWELWAPLLVGCRLVMAEPTRHGDPAYLTGVIVRHGITACDMVPSLLHHLIADPGFGQATRSLRLVCCGGEELHEGMARRFHAAATDTELLNFYGPTETTIDVTCRRVSSPVSSPVPIGGPMPGVELYVLDERFEPVPVGVPGELLIGGVQLARGYLNRPGQTAHNFVPHPFQRGRRLYRTGDRARWRTDGSVEYLGRRDQQVKIRGQRVEPAEVETCLRGHPDVGEAVVVARRGPDGDLSLLAYVTPAGADGADAVEIGALRQFLAGQLPTTMVPAMITPMEAFPLLPNGKIDRGSLSAAGNTRLAPHLPPTPPQNTLQQVLVDIWADKLEADVGIYDDFFELGGHSILATLIVAEIRDLFRIELPLHFFVNATTVSALTRLVREQGVASGVDTDRVAELIHQVQCMSADEVEARLRG